MITENPRYMDINAKINWKPGMEMTARTLAGMNQHIDFQQQVAIQAALGNTRVGLLPNAPFNNKGNFVRNTFEIEQFRCMALLPSGKIIDADEMAVVTIPMLYGTQYYLTVGFGEEETEFEKDGVAYIRPQYVYQIHTLDELEGKDVLPIVRFTVNDGVFSVDADFIPPTLQLVCDDRYQTHIQQLASRLETLATHDHMVDEFGKRALLHFLFVLKGYNLRNLTSDFIQFTQEIAQAVCYYILTPHTQAEQAVEIPIPSQYDVDMWLKWLDNYLGSAVSVLDQLELEDNSIDFEELKAQIKAELYGQMTPELHDKLLSEIKEELRTELEQHLSETLSRYMEQTLKPLLHDQLAEELNADLYQKLYDALYEALYNALFVPTVKEEDNFMPLI